METLVYKCHVDDSLTFEDMRKTPPIDQLRLMMCSVSVRHVSKRRSIRLSSRQNHIYVSDNTDNSIEMKLVKIIVFSSFRMRACVRLSNQLILIAHSYKIFVN